MLVGQRHRAQPQHGARPGQPLAGQHAHPGGQHPAGRLQPHRPVLVEGQRPPGVGGQVGHGLAVGEPQDGAPGRPVHARPLRRSPRSRGGGPATAASASRSGAPSRRGRWSARS
ncbi:hypothetical protein [Ornithinimicrobium kibberense]|uniref:hypothetical protein n=1 Tax=Ornithinimicrobium kibberense TaxID=282060 RepID=UPI00360E5C6C